MDTATKAFGYQDITCKLPVPLQSLSTLTISQYINEHIELRLTGIVPDSLEPRDIEAIGAHAPVEINLAGEDTPYFTGVCTNLTMNYKSGFKTITLEAKSWTYLLDISKKSRSYQKLGIPYEEFVGNVLKDYEEKDYIIALPEGKSYNTFAVQYWETEWEFLKRIAAREGTVLVAEYTDSSQRPRFWLGLPDLKAKDLTAAPEKGSSRDLETHMNVLFNRDSAVEDKDFLTYETTGFQIMHLGDKVSYRDKELIIIGIATELEDSLLKHTYTLGYSEKAALACPDNYNLTAVALQGKVLASRGVNSKIHLDIDETQDINEALWFPYAAASNNVMYCMPYNGEDINLYFRDGLEENAVAISGARKNGARCKKTHNYNNRYFATDKRKELFFSPDTVSFTADESAAQKITIKMIDNLGVFIDSKQDIGIGADINLNWQAEKEIMLEGMLGNSIIAADSSMILRQDVDIFGATRVELIGRVSNTFSDWDLEKDSIAQWRDEHPYFNALLESLPIIGTAAALYDAYEAYKEGDMVGAALNGGSAIISVIPGAKLLCLGGNVAIAAGSYAHGKGVI